MNNRISIEHAKYGFAVKVNGMYIAEGLDGIIRMVIGTNGIPDAATQWSCLSGVRDFWRRNRYAILAACLIPYKPNFGRLEQVANIIRRHGKFVGRRGNGFDFAIDIRGVEYNETYYTSRADAIDAANERQRAWGSNLVILSPEPQLVNNCLYWQPRFNVFD